MRSNNGKSLGLVPVGRPNRFFRMLIASTKRHRPTQGGARLIYNIMNTLVYFFLNVPLRNGSPNTFLKLFTTWN